ncbi:type I polyketide synthase [Alteromonas sp. a30]|uniref:type I polyketide synthase n=1 Tax=Alteromonas sp. a30 TaxID=2730917 RepID=UPI00227F7D95|nr:type I polyketide synthase [Alteromonas sp. a30]MCY7294927.1 SDR family NAD(P)-dependent oxidoreductase [Alteromonas sp. a30]
MSNQVDHLCNSVTQYINKHAAARGQDIAYRFVKFNRRNGEKIVESVSYQQLNKTVERVALHLSSQTQPQDRVVLAFRSGLEFLYGFYGCLQAGVVAVPVPLPRFAGKADRLASIVEDTGAALVLTTSELTESGKFDQINCPKVSIDSWLESEPQATELPEITGDMLAFLQYSSGSTSEPKGVMVTQQNLVEQVQLLTGEIDADTGSVMASWLPHFHDLGLVLGLINSVYKGGQTVFMAPETFIQKPVYWLRLISDYQANFTMAPNFAFDLCVQKIADADCEGVDLSSLVCAGIAAEPVRAHTIENFTNKFSSFGFQKSAFFPSYGLAEATLLVAGKGRTRTLNMRSFNSRDLDAGKVVACDDSDKQARRLVSNGQICSIFEAAIVDPETHQLVGPNQVGEIWIRGGSTTQGYWNRDEDNQHHYNVALEGGDENGYFRTGDIGFLFHNELYVCGRIKDLILIHGSNHHAADIETSIEAKLGDKVAESVAFSVDVDDQERLVVLLGLKKNEDSDPQLADEVISALLENHELAVDYVLAVTRKLPRTTSGKIRRNQCRQDFLNGTLDYETLYEKPKDAKKVQAVEAPEPEQESVAFTDELNWLFTQLGKHLQTDNPEQYRDKNLSDIGLSGSKLSILSNDLQKQYGRLLPPSYLAEFETVEKIAHNIADFKPASDTDFKSVDELLEENFDSDGSKDEPIAIIGVACRFPGAKNKFEFWENLCEGVDSLIEVPEDRWDIDSVYHENSLAVGKMNTRRAGFISDIDQFDRNFFSLSVRECVRMDPAHRLLMEVAWETFENAGVKPSSMEESNTSVVVGISGSDYAQLQFGDETLADSYAGLGSALTNAASRISHFYNLRGPALAVDTACSSSLTSVHMACKSIRSGECSMALAGGVNILLSPNVTMSLTKAGMMAPDGKCKTFDEKANGYVRAEGIGLVLLKPLSKAKADGNHICAVIRGSATNQDGKSSGISAPNGEAQQRVVLAACADAGIQPGDFDYVECHGTGTSLGDPIEVNALGEVLKIGADDNTKCNIGSVKTNIGHAESAAGIASLIKVTMMLENNIAPKSLNFETPNPAIDFDNIRAAVQTETGTLRKHDRPALIGVNSFGVGGTNVHIVLEEYENEAAPELPSDLPEQWMLPISAKSKVSLQGLASKIADYVNANPDKASLAALSNSLFTHREHLAHRALVTGKSPDTLVKALQAVSEETYHPSAVVGSALNEVDDQKLAFVYAGQGQQWWAMGRELFASEPVFREQVEMCDKEMAQYTDWSLIEELHKDEADSRLDDTEIAQPAIFAIQVGLTALWQYQGYQPSAVVGHSIGEVTAAYVAGCISFSEACHLIIIRARLMQAATGHGLMVSVESTLEEVQPYLETHADKVDVAAINGPTTLVLSGDVDTLHRVTDRLENAGIACVKLPVNYAFHSYQMEDSKHDLIKALSFLKPMPAKIPLVSTVSGEWLAQGGLLTPEYWGENLREKVMFKAGIETLVNSGYTSFVEISARPVLQRVIRKTAEQFVPSCQVVASLQKDEQEQESFAKSIGDLFVAGLEPHCALQKLYPVFEPRLPSYAWDQQRFWLDGPHVEARSRLLHHPYLQVRLPIAQTGWEVRLDHHISAYLTSLRVNGESRLPNGVAVELAQAISKIQSEESPLELQGVKLHSPAILKEGQALPAVQAFVFEQAVGFKTLEIRVQENSEEGKANNWRTLAEASLVPPAQRLPNATLNKFVLEERVQGLESFPNIVLYKKFAEMGLEYGAANQGITNLWFDSRVAVAELAPLENEGYTLDPRLVDTIEQMCKVVQGTAGSHTDMDGINAVNQISAEKSARYVEVSLKDTPEKAADFDVFVYDQEGVLLLTLNSLSFVASDSHSRNAGMPQNTDYWQYFFEWEESPEVDTQSRPHSENGYWLLLADSKGVSSQLSAWLNYNHQRFLKVSTGDAFGTDDKGDYLVDPTSQESIDTLIRTLFIEGNRQCIGIVHAWALDTHPFADTELANFRHDMFLSIISAAYTMGAASKQAISGRPRVYMLTQNGQNVLEGDNIEPAQASIWGFCKSVAIEHPEYAISRIDLPTEYDEDDMDVLCTEISSNSKEDQVAIRQGKRFVARMNYRFDPEAGSQEREYPDYELVPRWDEDTCYLSKQKSYRELAGADQVSVDVNQVLIAPSQLTHEGGVPQVNLWSGVVADTQETVFSMIPVTLSNHICVNKDALTQVEGDFSLAKFGCSIQPNVIAHLVLSYFGKIQKGQYVWVNGIETALGSAFAVLAKLVGAKVLATSAQHLDTEQYRHVTLMGSLADCTQENVHFQTKQRGVDLFVNCLTHADLLHVSGFMHSFGTFIDMASEAQGLGANLQRLRLTANQALRAVDIHDLVSHNYDLVKASLEYVIEGLQKGRIKADVQVVQMLTDNEIAVEANAPFILTLPEGEHTAQNSVYHKDATYLVTGGLGGLGLSLAKRLARQGAGNLVLLGRRAPSLKQMDEIAAIEMLGAKVTTFPVDVADEEQVKQLFATLRESLPPLKGIFHAAGMLRNALLLQLEQDHFLDVFAAKVQGSWNLHVHSQQDDLDFFVMFSSLASAIGSPGQSNYSAANGFLDGLSEYRKLQGLPGTSVCWGPWEDVGMAAAEENLDKLSEHGIGTIALEKGLALLDELIEQKLQGCVASLPMDWALWSRYFPTIAVLPFVSNLVPEQALSQSQMSKITREHILNWDSEKQLEAVKDALVRAVSQAMMLSPESVSLTTPLTALGLDSIVALELKTRIEGYVDVVIQTFTLLKGYDINELAEILKNQMLEGETEVAASEDVSTENVEDDLSEMSADEVDALLRELSEE